MPDFSSRQVFHGFRISEWQGSRDQTVRGLGRRRRTPGRASGKSFGPGGHSAAGGPGGASSSEVLARGAYQPSVSARCSTPLHPDYFSLRTIRREGTRQPPIAIRLIGPEDAAGVCGNTPFRRALARRLRCRNCPPAPGSVL